MEKREKVRSQEFGIRIAEFGKEMNERVAGGSWVGEKFGKERDTRRSAFDIPLNPERIQDLFSFPTIQGILAE